MGNSGTSMTSSLNGGEPTIFNHSQCNNPDITATRVDWLENGNKITKVTDLPRLAINAPLAIFSLGNIQIPRFTHDWLQVSCFCNTCNYVFYMTFELDENGYHFENQAYTQTLSTKAIKLLDNDKRIIIELVDHMNYLKGEGKVFHELNNNCKDYAASAWKQIVLKNQN